MFTMNRTALCVSAIAAIAVGCIDQGDPADDSTTVSEQNATVCGFGATFVPTFNGPTLCARTYTTVINGAYEDWHMLGSSIAGGLRNTGQKFDVILMSRYLGVPFVAIRCPNGAYLSAANGGGGTAQCNRSAVGAWETFRIESGADYAFETHDGHFLQMPHTNGPLEAVATWVGKAYGSSWEQFDFAGADELCGSANQACPAEAGRWL
jgi:hypothetical protein